MYGIRHEKTISTTLQYNGMAEMMNHSIIKSVKCMLKTTKLSKVFQGEVAQTVCYLINRSPLGPLNIKVLEKVWIEIDVSYFDLRVFGCETFVHIPKEQRFKLNDKAIPQVFVGYDDEEFGLMLWDPTTKKLVKSRHVIF